MTELTWEQAQADFPALMAAAVEGRTCFCKCGCRAEDTEPMLAWGRTVPGRCARCRKGAAHLHEQATPGSIWNDAADAAEDAAREPRSLRRFITRIISKDKRAEAEAYAREYGAEGAVFMSSMSERVREGKPLTDAQVEAVLRSKAAETRSAKAVLRRAQAEQRRAAAHVDLARIRIPDDLEARFYAVQGDDGAWVVMEVEKPTKGTLRGFIVVKASINGALTKYGAQYPQPYRDADTHPQTYRGHMPHLVHELVENPEAAAKAYEDLMG